ncbi:hypothetical protein APTSU1_000468300 [Apodemus speciosus]|uniref:Gamma-retroviral matrix protein domain-containing protein n=1 Tax=Apodemus speciosus TaxID=105296 RepID=A0ABQ0EQX1_APOSI
MIMNSRSPDLETSWSDFQREGCAIPAASLEHQGNSPLTSLVREAFKAINTTNLEATKSCWFSITPSRLMVGLLLWSYAVRCKPWTLVGTLVVGETTIFFGPGRAHNLSVEVRKGKWQTFCTSEWPTFVKKIVFQESGGHPDQVPYIVTWQDLVQSPPPWMPPVAAPSAKIAVASSPPHSGGARRPTAPPPTPIYPAVDDLLLLSDPPPYPAVLPPPAAPQPARPLPAPGPAPPDNSDPEGPAAGTRSRRARSPAGDSGPDSTVALPLRAIGPPLSPTA